MKPDGDSSTMEQQSAESGKMDRVLRGPNVTADVVDCSRTYALRTHVTVSRTRLDAAKPRCDDERECSVRHKAPLSGVFLG